LWKREPPKSPGPICDHDALIVWADRERLRRDGIPLRRGKAVERRDLPERRVLG
ncbi:MAG: hypothetical protein ACI80K_001970, partial [Paracoccaceae bacterium]